MNYNEFMKNVEEFVFAESQPEKADIIFVPGNGFPDMAEKAASLYKDGYAPYILPSGRLHLANLQVCSQKKKYMAEIMRRNGNS